jgi:dihydroorotase
MMTSALTPKGEPVSEPFDLVLAGGRAMDPSTGLDAPMDIGIREGRVGAIEPDLADAKSVVDCSGAMITPGLIDAHSHIFADVSKVGAPVEDAHLRRGVVAVADAGTAGSSTFSAFRKYVVEATDMRVLSFLNVSALGLIDFRFGELLNPATLVPDDAVEQAARNGDVIRGLKIRLSTDVVGQACLPLLEQAVATGDRCGLPLMVHIGETASSLEDILDRLRPGDIVAHCYTGKPRGILSSEGKVLGAVWSARERGVLFECAHGKTNFSYAVAESAIDQGFLPDVVCSDTSYRNWNGPVFDLVTTMSKLVSLGMDLGDVLARATVRPAQLLGLWDEGYGRIGVGAPAHITVLRQGEESERLADGAGGQRGVRRLEPILTVHKGRLVDPLPWRGLESSGR